MSAMEWARADMDPEDPASQGYDPSEQLAPDLAALKAAVIAKQTEWVHATVRITLLATELFDSAFVDSWMRVPNEALGGRVPAILIAAGHADEVEQLLQGLADGVMG